MSAPFIRVVDIEATGFDPAEHAPVEVGVCDLAPSFDLLGEPDWSQSSLRNGWGGSLLNPKRTIPPETSAIHHLIECDLVGAPDWEQGLIAYVGGVTRPIAFAAHSLKLERQWCTPDLVGDAPWIDTYKCALRAWPDAPGHGNQVLRYWLRPLGIDRHLASPAHRAGPDAYVTAFLLRDLLAQHPLHTLIQWSTEPAILIRVPFGKRPEEGGSRGMKWSEVDDSLLYWTIERDFGEDILFTVEREIERRKADTAASATLPYGSGNEEEPF
jgi:exodeoxyribonuclease X